MHRQLGSDADGALAAAPACVAFVTSIHIVLVCTRGRLVLQIWA